MPGPSHPAKMAQAIVKAVLTLLADNFPLADLALFTRSIAPPHFFLKLTPPPHIPLLRNPPPRTQDIHSRSTHRASWGNCAADICAADRMMLHTHVILTSKVWVTGVSSRRHTSQQSIHCVRTSPACTTQAPVLLVIKQQANCVNARWMSARTSYRTRSRRNRLNHAKARSTTQRCRPNRSLDSRPRRAILTLMPRWWHARRHWGMSYALSACSLSGRRRPRPRRPL
jgi:hypothetical protein